MDIPYLFPYSYNDKPILRQPYVDRLAKGGDKWLSGYLKNREIAGTWAASLFFLIATAF
jgi:hypothetical protein